MRTMIARYLQGLDLSDDEIAAVEDTNAGRLWESSRARSTLLLLRGLIMGGILTFALGQKRWRVNYGLVSTRSPPTKLAVPFRAKDSPTPRSEFSHPDVVIVLTSLAYYYAGLDDDDLFAALESVMCSDQASIEYGHWVKHAPDMPEAFWELDGINIKDRIQCVTAVFPHLRFVKAVIDYFLSTLVFPNEMKDFQHKMSASGWDIGMDKKHPTTGFSGTNDSRKLLPLDINHLDLARQKHTNALVLNHILCAENGVFHMPQKVNAATTEAERLVSAVVSQNPQIHVILDVGAQILEMNNLNLAQRWLELETDGRMQAVSGLSTFI